MFGIGSTELLVILVVALIVLGPRNLPKIAQTLGRALGQFQRVSKDFQRTLNTEIAFEEENEKQKEQERLIAEQVARQKLKQEQEESQSPIATNSSSKIVNSYTVSPESRASLKTTAESVAEFATGNATGNATDTISPQNISEVNTESPQKENVNA